MVWDTMAMLVWDTMVMLVWDTMVMVLAMVITMERGKLNLLLKLKLTLLFSTAPTDMVLAMATMASVQHRWCNTFSCHSVRAWRESHTSIESYEIVIKEQIMFP